MTFPDERFELTHRAELARQVLRGRLVEGDGGSAERASVRPDLRVRVRGVDGLGGAARDVALEVEPPAALDQAARAARGPLVGPLAFARRARQAKRCAIKCARWSWTI